MQRFVQAVRQYFPEGTKINEPAGGFILWLSLPAGTSAMDLHYRALEHSIVIVPGDLFSNTEHFSNYLRLSTAVPWTDEIEQAIKQLGQLVADQKKCSPAL